MRLYRILGVTITDEAFEAAADHVRALVDGTGPRSLVFVNAHTLNHAAADPAFRDTLNAASLVFGDGTGVRWAARLQGLRLQANLNGTDLVPAVLTRRPGVRCYLVGSAPDRIALVLEGARRLFPEVEFVGAHHGYLDEAASRTVAEDIRRSGANLVLVGMGNPIQERWVEAHREAAPDALFVAVGGFFEYWHGNLQRAPGFMRRAGLEWVHLMMRQPRKVPRYLLGNPLYLARVMRSLPKDRAFRERLSNASGDRS